MLVTFLATTLVLLATPFVVGTFGDLLAVVLEAVVSGFRVGVVVFVVDDAPNDVFATELFNNNNNFMINRDFFSKDKSALKTISFFTSYNIITMEWPFHTFAVKVDDFVGDNFGAAVFVMPVVVEVFGLVNVVERTVDVAGADLTRDVAVEDVVEVAVFVALTRDAAIVLVAGLLTVLQ